MTPYLGDRYLDYPEVESWLHQASETAPSWCGLQEIGRSLNGRSIWLLSIGVGSDAERDRRPGFWLDGGTHASEWTGVMSCLFTASRWLSALTGDDPARDATRRWFSQHTAYVLACVSPDGFQAIHEGASPMRSTLRPPPEGAVRVGMSPRDIDGDGAIRWMRWRHPAGPYVQDPDQPLLMRHRRLEDDPADAFFLCDEGDLLAWDGARWTEAPREFGLDLNRNFPGHWAPFRMFGMDSGDYPLSAPESRAVVEAVRARPFIGAAVTNHTYTGALLTQPYRKDSPLGDGDIRLMELLAKGAVRGTGYRAIRVYPDFMYDPDKPTVGVWADTLSSSFAIPGYTLELWDPLGFAGLEAKSPVDFFMRPDFERLKILFDRFAALPGAATPWRAFEHPQLGPVEIGGLDYLRTVRNPPIDLLPAECERGFTVADRVRRSLPRVQATLQTEPAGSGLRRVSLVLENLGFLSTASLARGESLVPTPNAQLALPPGCERVAGPPIAELGHLDGWGAMQTDVASNPIYASLADRGHRALAEWLVRGEGPVSVRWWGGRGGSGVASAE